MDFFERQDRARTNSKRLVFYFATGVAMLILAVYLACLLIFVGLGEQAQRRHTRFGQRPPLGLWHSQVFFGATVGTLAVVIMGSMFKIAELSKGGSSVAEMLGGRPVNPDTRNPEERKLLNVVEEMALASGVPVPQVYLLAGERGINAFAAGHSTSDAVIGVTDGAMRLLSRDELQGVVAHEFSHILNGDMRLNLRLMGWIFGILCLAIIGRVLLRTRGRKNPLPVLGLALVIIGWVGVVFGRFIQAAVSRQREFLADASAVQFTRSPEGLAGALKKIGGLAYGSRLETPQAAEASHMFFGEGLGRSFFGLMATHPPLEERVRALDPSFDGKFPRVEFESARPARKALAPGTGLPPVAPIPFPARNRIGAAGMAEFAVPPVIPANAIVQTVGTPTSQHLRYAAGLRSSFPSRLEAAARESLGAATVVYALLLSEDEVMREKQLDLLSKATSAEVAAETMRLWPEVREVAVRARLPLVDLALPGLRQLSPAQFQQFRTAIQQLAECDSEIDLFEYMLRTIVVRHLEPNFVPVRKPVVQYYSLKPLARDCAVLLSGLARIGADSEERGRAAFRQGIAPLTYAAQEPIEFVPADECDLSQVDAALERLSLAVPQIKKNVLHACAQTVASDGLIREMEMEMLRAVADRLECPIPPAIQAAEKSAGAMATS